MVGETNVLTPPCCCSTSSLDQERKSWLGHVTTYEPLKVCLDDDSSNEDGDEDMFDDDAFTFGDEDFQAIMSHEAMRRMSTRITQVPHSYGRPAAQSSSDISPQNPSFLPSNQSAPLLTNKVSDISADSSPATSSGSLGTLASHTSCNSLSQRTKSKRKVSLHNDVAVIPIPSHNEYLHRERLWCSASELYHNAARNTIEFAAEGFNWRNVADDDQMIEAPSGERIHPIHFMNIANFRSSAMNNQQDHDDRRN